MSFERNREAIIEQIICGYPGGPIKTYRFVEEAKENDVPDTPIDGAMIGVRNMFIIGGGDPAFFEKALAAHDAQVLRNAAEEYGEVATEPGTEQVPDGWRFLTVAEWLRARADRIAGGTSRPVDRAAYAASQREPSQEERDRVRMLLTHPHDGHGPSDTCLECQRTDQQNSQETK